MKYVLFALGFLIVSLITNLVRRKRIINFLIFCGTETPDSYFAKVVNRLLLIDLEFYKLSLVYYFNKNIQTNSGNGLCEVFNNLKEVKNLKKRQICQQAFRQSLSLVNPKKLAKFYVKILRISYTGDYKPGILPLILEIVKDLEDETKYLFTSVLNEESMMLSFVFSGYNKIFIEDLNKAVIEIEQSKT